MRIKTVLLTALFLAYGSLGFAQSSERQRLRRYDPQMQSTEQDFGQDKLYVSYEKGIPLSTEQALVGYITRDYKLAQTGIAIYRLRDAHNLYFVIATVHKDRRSIDSPVQTIFLVLREQGATVSEVSKVENDSDAASKEPVFFPGRNKLLIIVSHTAGDGSFGGNYAYEYTAHTLKALGQIDVIEKTGMSGSVWLTHSPIGQATAEYKNNTYYVTMRGKKGNLYANSDPPKKLASPGSPVTFSYDEGDWRPVATKQTRRR